MGAVGGWIALALISALLGAELLAWSAPAQRWILRRASRSLPRPFADRYYEEWCAELAEIPDGPLTRLIWCVHIMIKRRDIAGELVAARRPITVRTTIKASIDKAAAAGGLVVLAPVLLVIAIAIKIDSPGPVFFRQERIGANGTSFKIVKFRTMYVNAEQLFAHLWPLNEGDGPLFKFRRDPRVTGVGRVLRALSLDELPQLVNVLSGSMSLVGPRPPLPEEAETYLRVERRRLLVKPGLTGLWQVDAHRSGLTWAESVKLDIKYVDSWSLRLDLQIIARTVWSVLRRPR